MLVVLLCINMEIHKSLRRQVQTCNMFFTPSFLHVMPLRPFHAIKTFLSLHQIEFAIFSV